VARRNVTRGGLSRSDGASQLPASERIYNQLKESILTGSLESGSRLVELTLASDLGVSRTPIREALKRLSVEGLVTLDPVRGMIVRRIDPHEVEDFYITREVLDGLAARLAAQRVSGDQLIRLGAILDAMESAQKRGDRSSMVQANMRFHDAVFRAGANQWLAALGRSMIDFVRLLSAAAYTDPVRDREVIQEHRAVQRALEAKDGDAAEAAAREHMVQARLHFVRESAAAESV
jgi:DNA-binding GntR family transcriptional regulator